VWGLGSGDRVVQTALREAMHAGHDPRDVREWPLRDLELFMTAYTDTEDETDEWQ
jgi:hypothetical protein